MMQRCQQPDCGSLNRPQARFCARCGQPLADRGAPARRAGDLMRGGTYRILEVMGKGGMGALYLAADTGAFDRRCVVKELLAYYDPTDPEAARQAQARFETEARLLAELSHPGIPRIYSYFSEAGRHYIVMEYIEGETLEGAVTHVDALGREVAARPLSAEEVVRHAIRVCRVLEYLADQPTPVVHHDIKPANLIVDRTSGEVRLVDFGTARARWAAEASSLFGTPGYAAPEQYQGHSDPRSDVYALAATVYHLLTDDDPGDHPFRFPQLEALPVPLAEALSRGLRLDVERRCGALEFRQALETWLVPEEAAQPFVFSGGAVAHTTTELVAICDQRWSEGREHLTAGHFEQWFRNRNRYDLVAKSQSSKLEKDANAALEVFLRRLNPRLPQPQLVVEPDHLHFGRATRNGLITLQLRVRNEGRGYGQVRLSTTSPWLKFEQQRVGCLAGAELSVPIYLDTAALPLRRAHQGIITCELGPGGRMSIPVEAELNLVGEALRRVASGLGKLVRLMGIGARKGGVLWNRAFWSLIRSRPGRWILVAETLLLAAVMVFLWIEVGWPPVGVETSPPASPEALRLVHLLALPLAVLTIYLLPAFLFLSGAAVWEVLRTLLTRSRVG
jgi:serine/threonine protein kinase